MKREEKTSLSLHAKTKQRLYKTRGKMESKNGEKRTLEDVINQLIDYFEESKV